MDPGPSTRPRLVIPRVVLLAASAVALSLILGATGPTSTPTPTMTPTVSPTGTPTPGPTSTTTRTPGPSATATLTLTVTATATLEPTATATATRTPTATPTAAPPSRLPSTQPGLSRYEGVFLVTAADNGSRADYFIAGNSRHSILAADMQLELQRNPLWPVRSATRDEVLSFVEGAPIGAARAGLVSAPAIDAETAPEPVAEINTTVTAVRPIVVAPAPAPAPTPAALAAITVPPVATPAPVAAAPADASEPIAAAPDAVESQPLEQARVAETSLEAQPTVHVLQPGDNLTRLSAQYGTTIGAILAANRVTDANRIYVGQSLVIPPAAAPAAPIVEAPQPPVADVPGSRTYVVRSGDSAIAIARQVGVDLDTLLSVNGVANRNRVYVGQVLTIPS